jgi:hypothetical protein
LGVPISQTQPSASSLDDQPDLSGEPRRSAVNFRSIFLGTLLSALIAGFTPYNDFVIGNGFVIACYLPVGYFFFMFVLTAGVNAPLRKWLPRWTFSSGELAVITLMALTACSVPCQGLLRSFLPTLVFPFDYGTRDHQFWLAFTSLGLPSWLFPVGDVSSGLNSPIAHWFYTRVPQGEAIPYRAWFGPLLIWGSFFVCLFAALVSSATLIFPQWAQNERLSFPIAQLELALIAEPEKGRAFNALYRSRLFWIGTIIVFCLHSIVCLNEYFPKQVPNLTLSYDLRRIMTAEPWVYLNDAVKRNTIIFLIVGMAYFIPARVGFSIWASFVLMQIATVTQQLRPTFVMSSDSINDQHFGATVVYVAGVFWVGRQYWKTVLAQSLGRYRWPVAIFVTGIIGMSIWLMILGVSLPMALLIVASLLLVHVTVARVVAETGLPIFRSYVTPGQFYTRLSPTLYSGRDVYFAQVFSANGAFATRESAMTFVQHGLWVFDRSTTPPPSRKHIGLLMTWALVLSFVIGTWSSLHCYYRYSVPLTSQLPQTKFNDRGVNDLPRLTVAAPLTQYKRGYFNTPDHSPLAHITAGAILGGVLSVLSLRYASWPLLPVGYVISTELFINWFWYSVLLGWLAKVLVLRFGGAKMFQNARPLFIGLIAGEVLAAAAWLVVNLMLASMHYDYRPAIFYPS